MPYIGFCAAIFVLQYKLDMELVNFLVLYGLIELFGFSAFSEVTASCNHACYNTSGNGYYGKASNLGI